MYRDDPNLAGAQAAPQREVLPTNVRPHHYDLTLEPDLVKHTYDGTVVIDLAVNEDSTSITLNTIDITVKHAKLTGDVGSIADSLDVKTNTDAQTTTFSSDASLKKGSKVKLHIDFSAPLNDNMAGFYRSAYNDKDGNKKFMATTQMEPTDARRAFPCFDEPALKATFDITLVADKHLTCLSNMDQKSETEVDSKMSGGKKKAVTFNTTPLVSTYLLAFIVGELNCVETNSFRIPVRVFAPPDQDIESGRFSVELAAKTLDFYETKFDMKYPLPKMDMIAIPDFSAGAMENWGLVTYRVVDLLFDEKTMGASTKQRVAEVVQHELAHQWFGNLVTMDFWEGLWLNEGFATWMSWYSCNAFYPEWKVWETYITDNLQSALSLDGLRSSHPIEVPVKRADDINQIFDAISYSKGSCVLRMISKYLGEETFLAGIRIYLKRHAYGNTTTTDLWNALSEASGKDVAAVMDVWTRKVGYPVVTVTEDEKSSTVHVKQNRFLRTADVKPEEDQTLYPVFLALRTKEGVDEEISLFDRERSFKVPDMNFFKINADHSGTYRTYYSSDRLKKLGEAGKAGLLTTEDRAGMVADAGALASAGYQPSSGTLSLLKGFSEEPEYVVWDEVNGWLGSIRNAFIFNDQSTRDALKAFQCELSSKKAHELGWTFHEDDENVLQQFKSLMFASAGSSGDKKIIEAAKEMFANRKKSPIHPNLRGAVYSIVLQYDGTEETYDGVLNEYRHGATGDERNTALRSLGRARDPKLIQRTLDLAFGDEVRTQDIYLPLAGLRTHPDGINALWDTMKKRWEEITKRLPPGLGMLGGVVQICTASFTKKEQMDDVEKFFKDRNTRGFDQSLAQSLDSIRAKLNWVERDESDVNKWLQEGGYLS